MEEVTAKTILVTCTTCKRNCTVCKIYVDAEFCNFCFKSAKCNTIENIAKSILEYLGYEFISLDLRRKEQLPPMVYFLCINGHESELLFTNLIKGSTCKKCTHMKLTKPKKESIFVRPPCGCKGKRGKGNPVCCPHYNHLVICPKSGEMWSNENTVKVSEISPQCRIKYKWNCPKCGKIFEQTPRYRSKRDSHFCSANCRVEIGKDLKSMYPQIVELMDVSNTINPSEVTCGSSFKIKILCTKHTVPFVFKVSIKRMCIKFKTYKGTGTVCCGYCNSESFKQVQGGHDYFVKKANKVHNFLYKYPDQYINGSTKIGIFCQVANHGLFYQDPGNHKQGAGCWQCAATRKESKAAQRFRALLKSMKIKFDTEVKFDGMEYKRGLKMDFYLNDINLGGEIDGVQHFKVTSWGGDDAFEVSRIRDVLKDIYCLQNGINLYRFPYSQEVDKNLLLSIIDMCKPGKKQVYASYPQYINQVKELIDLSNFNVIVIESPIKV